MASVAAENGDNIKSTCYHYITCRNSNFIINVKKNKYKIMSGFITILLIAWIVLLCIVTNNNYKYNYQENAISNQTALITNQDYLIMEQKKSINSLTSTIERLNHQIKDLDYKVFEIKNYIDINATKLVTHDALNSTRDGLHSDIKSFGEKVEMVNTIGEVKINDTHTYLTKMMDNSIENIKTSFNKNLTQLKNSIEQITLNSKKQYSANKYIIKENITKIRDEFYSYKIIMNISHDNLKNNIKNNVNKNTAMIISTNNTLHMKVNNMEQRLNNMETLANESTHSLKIYLNNCPEGWSLYTNMATMLICYKN